MSNKKFVNRALKKQHINRIYYRLKLLALNCFEYENLPPGIEERYIEKALYSNGQAFFYKHKEYGLVCLPCSPSTSMDIYEEPTHFNVYGYNMATDIVHRRDGVRILNNKLALPNKIYCHDYACRMYEIERSINANIKQMKIPFAMKTNNKKLLTDRNIIDNIEDGDPWILLSDDYDTDNIQAINLNIPMVFKDLQEQKNNLSNEILSFFGINNANTGKRERMIVDEVNSNNEFINSNLSLMLEERQKAFEKINEMFDCNIVVKLKKSFMQTLEGDENNGWFYNPIM